MTARVSRKSGRTAAPWVARVLLCLLIALGAAPQQGGAAAAGLYAGHHHAGVAHEDGGDCPSDRADAVVCCHAAAGCAAYLPQASSAAAPGASGERCRTDRARSGSGRAVLPQGHPPRILTQA
jgi:hypothetical protein